MALIDMRENVVSGGNVDTENGGMGQAFKTPTNSALGTEDLYNHNAWKGDFVGNANTDTGQWRLPDRRGGAYYNEIGLNPWITDTTGAYDNMLGWGNPMGAPPQNFIDRMVGAGGGSPQMQKMDYYQALGQQLRSALQGPQGAAPQSAPLNIRDSGYANDWLAQDLAAGSANGAKIGGMMSGGGGGGTGGMAGMMGGGGNSGSSGTGSGPTYQTLGIAK